LLLFLASPLLGASLERVIHRGARTVVARVWQPLMPRRVLVWVAQFLQFGSQAIALFLSQASASVPVVLPVVSWPVVQVASSGPALFLPVIALALVLLMVGVLLVSW